jgi:hypothetical protein
MLSCENVATRVPSSVWAAPRPWILPLPANVASCESRIQDPASNSRWKFSVWPMTPVDSERWESSIRTMSRCGRMLSSMSDPLVAHARIAWLAASEPTGPGIRVQKDIAGTPPSAPAPGGAARASAPGNTIARAGSPSDGLPAPSGGPIWCAIRSGSSLVSNTSDLVSRRSPCHAVTRSLAQVRPEWNDCTSSSIGSA